MNHDHVSSDDLALYVMNALPPSSSVALEAHVVHCPACAAALAREARLEVALHDAGAAITARASFTLGDTQRAPGARARPRLRLRRATAAAFASALALAAGYLLWIARSGHDVARAAERSSLIACAPGTGEAAASCYARARQMGLYVQDPPRSAPIPIYEALTPAGTSAPRP